MDFSEWSPAAAIGRMPKGALAAAGLVAMAIAVPPAWGASPDMDPATGYRIQNYRSPVTLPVQGGDRISTAEVERLMKAGAVLVDVMPARAGYDPATGRWRLVEKRDDIPGSTWLPNTGRGELEPALSAYFRNNLQSLTGNQRDRPLVFYCMADCWMSWNAVKRAAALGYTNVHWFADGTDGWSEAGHDLVPGQPKPVSVQALTR